MVNSKEIDTEWVGLSMTAEQEQIAMLTAKVKEQAEIIDYLTRKMLGNR